MDRRAVPSLDIGEFLDGRRIGAFHARVFCLCLLILFVNGLDYSAANVAAPAIIAALGAGTGAMGLVFSMGFVGILAGSILFGWIGDTHGRKIGAVAGVLAFSVPALLTVFAGSIDELVWYRAAAGLGIGGVIPNIVALLTETAPKRYRVTFVMAVFIGYSLGNAAIGQIAAVFIPAFGWQSVFLIAGAAGLLLSILLILFLPESIAFLAATNPASQKLRRLLARLAPEIAIGPGTQLTYRRPKKETAFSLSLLFDGFRRIATPVIWAAFFIEALTYMTLSAWYVLLLEKSGLTPQEASLAYSAGQIGAIPAIIILARAFDRFGPLANAASSALAALAIAAMGMKGVPPAALIATAVLALTSASATHQSLNGMVGGFYPTVVRGNGIGYATGMGRLGSIFGPSIAGVLMTFLPPETVLAAIAAPELGVALCCLALARVASGHWHGKIPAGATQP